MVNNRCNKYYILISNAMKLYNVFIYYICNLNFIVTNTI